MRFLLLSLVFLGTLFANPYKNLVHYTLSNGLEVYLLPDEKSKNIHIEVDVKVGMGVEDENNAGISHLVEHIVFRDQRVKNSDYYNVIKDKGATFVNGYTSYYTTQYLTTINPENAYWITETFSKMLFDKNVTDEDLRVEKGALQIEIGEPNWTDIFDTIQVGKFFKFIGNLFPPSPDIYEDDFKTDPDATKVEYQKDSHYKNNNKDFSLQEVMAHYHDYYYPSNMILKIVGKFDLQKMKETINKTFAKVEKRSGKTLKEPIIKDATLDDKPYLSYENAGMEDSTSVQLGMKLLADDPQKVLIIESYMNNLADRLNKEFRNKKGETYSVSGGIGLYRNAAIASIYFSSPHEAFDKNIAIAKAWMMREGAGDINDSTIQEALQEKLKHYEAVGHDVDSLMGTIGRYEYYKKLYPKYATQTPYALFKEITPQKFRETLKKVFLPQHAYTVIQRDYLWFPYEGSVLVLVLMILFIYAVIKIYGAHINKRKVKFSRRLSSRFTTFVIILISIMIAEWIYEWIVYLLFGSLDNRYDIPLSYLIMIGDFLASLVVLYVVAKKLFSWFYAKMFITKNTLTLVGAKSKYIPLKNIAYCEIVPWSPKLWGKIHGVSLLFWRPLLKIVSHDDEEIYIRSNNAQHLKEDLSTIITPSPTIEKIF